MSQVCEEMKIACGERRAKTLEHHPLEHEKGARAGGHCPKAIGRLKRVREPQCVLMFERDFITMGREVKARGAGVGQVEGKDKERVSGEKACAWWEDLCALKGRAAMSETGEDIKLWQELNYHRSLRVLTK